ncbi:MAG: hypothetical protein HY403_01150 [Elusimicrobia bacterium]|nr:hypothetical protein [Elusimicrobiota bacterium]
MRRLVGEHGLILPASLFLLVAALSLALRHRAITETSPTFDEPYYLYLGLHHDQTGRWHHRDPNPPLFPWLVAKLAPLLGRFPDVEVFARGDSFHSSYQYRLDAFSGLPGDACLQRGRWLLQPFWILLGASLAVLARRLGLSVWGQLVLFAFVSLEPSWVGVSSLIRNDLPVLALLCCATALAGSGAAALQAAGFLVFSMAWAMKFTSALWIVPLGLGWYFGKLPRRTIVLWLAGLAGGGALSWLLDYPDFLGGTRQSGLRLGFLDGKVFERAPLHYFIAGLAYKSSLAAYAAAAYASYRGWRGRRRGAAAAAAAVLAASLLAATAFTPGLGTRLVMPLTLTLFILIAHAVDSAPAALLLVSLLAAEAAAHRDGLLSYQNPLAGRAPRVLDSDCDWGQGLKQLARWRRSNPEGTLALALFGGALPEAYGITDYLRLPSFPELPGGKPMPGGFYSGYAAVSRNYLYGLYIDNPDLRRLAEREPARCFQGALCLYDLRGPAPPAR